MKTLILLLLMMFTICTFAIANAPSEVKYESKMGTITFDHTNHSTQFTDCAVCHHTEGEAACATCHGVDTAIPTVKKAFHANCKACHKAEAAGPTKCKECHIK